ncbi:MAG: SdrD B-like domain-containing protein, partial [Sideroxyarcus sp.]|nr:SdrD B-like domain-containing protein [Sideroxyarcus sp.]
GNAAIVSQAASSSVTVYENLNVSKTISPVNAAAGNPVKYTFAVQNWSAAAITDLTVTDTLTNGQTYLTGMIGANDYTPALTGTGCSGLSVTGAVGATAPVFTIASVPARASVNSPGSCTVTFWAKTSATASAYSNVLGAGSVCYGTAPVICNGGSSNSVSGTSVGVSALGVAKTFSQGGTTNPPTVLARAEGTVVRMTLTFSNLSANPLTGVTVSDTLPTSAGAQMRIATPSNAATTCGGTPVITATANSTSVSMNGATIPARAASGTGAAGSCLLQVDVVGPAGTYSNTATATGTETYGDATTHTVGPVTSNAAVLTYTSALSATKTFAPASVSSGGKSTVTVRLNNSGAVALGGVAVTDPLPTGMVLSNPPNAYTTCAGGTTLTAVAGAGSIGMSGASIAGAGNCDLVFDVNATGSANWVNTIPVGNITASGGVSNQTAVVGTLTYTAPIGITVAKATNPSTLTFPGQISQLTITLNNGSQAVSGLSLTDYFTADGTAAAAANGMAIAPTPSAATTCPGGVVSAAPGATSVGLTGAAMAASASCTVTVNVTSTSVGGITNYIPIGSIATNQGLTNSGQASTSLTTQSNIGVTKQFTPNVVTPGTRSRLRITFYNPTAQPGTNITVTDNLPAGVSVPSGANPQTTCTGATVSSPVNTQVQVSGGSIVAASGGVAASCYAEIDVVAAAQGDYVNTIAAGTVTASVGGTTASNSQPTSDVLRVKSPVVVHTAFSSMTLDAGNPVGFTTGSDSKAPGAAAVMTIRLDNPNAADLTSAAFTDTLPTGLVVGTTPNASTTCTGGSVIAAASGTTVRLTGATIPATGYCTVTVNVLSNISASYTNTIAAGGVTTYEGVSNAEPTSARIVISTPPTVSKQFSPAVIAPSGTSTLTIVLGNSNTGAVTLTSAFTDTLPTAPGNIVVAATPNVVKTCPGAVTATAGSGTITYANGAQIPAGGCTISVNVTGATPGDHTNNIPAGTLTTDFGNNQQAANAVLTVSTLAYVSGRVFQDNNVTPNGTYESGTDTPLAGVSIELHSGATCSGALISSASTDVLGNYMFAGLSAGTYSVCEPVQPAGTSNGITTAGAITPVNGSTGTAGVASNPTAGSSQVVNIVLNGDGGSSAMSGTSGNSFAEIVLSGISGTVFLDQNNNGVQNGADTGIAGVTVELLDNTNAVISTTTTDASGNYSFTGLVPGNYAVREPNQPAGTSNGITTAGAVGNGGTAGSVTSVTTAPSVIGGATKITLPPNTMSTGNNFADIPNGRSLTGRVFLDYDNSGTLNGPDHGIGQQTINLTGTDINGNAVAASTTTVSAGTYTFSSLPEGTYTVTEPAQPAGTTNGITTAGSTGGTATTVGVTPSAISAISLLGGNTVSADNNFADVPDAAADLAISKTHSPASFGESSSTGYFTITPSNIGTVATSGTITVVDTLPAGMTVAAAATGTGWTCSGAAGATTVTCTSTDVIAAGGTGNPVTLRVMVANGLAGQILTNTAVISGGGEPVGFDSNNTATDSVVISTTAALSGTVWFDANHNRVLEVGETASTLIAGWQVELMLGGVQVASATTNSSGAYSFVGIAPGNGYTLRFRHPATGLLWGSAVANEQGVTAVNGTRDNAIAAVNGTNSGNPAGATINGDGTLSSLSLFAGDNIVQQSLPLDPAGVIYDSVTHNPVSGAVVTISGPAGFTAANVVGGSLSQTTAADGLYQFLLNPSAPSGIYTLEVTSYPAGYLPTASVLIPPCTNVMTVDNLPNPALVQAANTAPSAATTVHNPATCPTNTASLNATNQATTQYYFSFNLSTTAPVSANVVNNHIAIDPILGGAIAMSKKTPLVNVSRGDLVPYTITATNTLSATLGNIDVRDQLPPGFKFKIGTATLDGVPVAPVVNGRVLTWPNLTFTAHQSRVIRLTTVVGSGVSEGNYVNQAYALNNIVNASVSNTATATVRVVPDPDFDCSDVIGKVFDDKNINGYQDAGEPGIPNIRLATVNGLLVTTDAQGRYHVTCAMVPNELRGSNFLMKLDERTLPTGFRVTTENPRDVRLTRGKI